MCVDIDIPEEAGRGYQIDPLCSTVQEGFPKGSDAETEPSREMDPRQRRYVEDPERAGRSLDGVTLLNWRHL